MRVKECDVLVVGGGSAGIAAASAASQAGGKVIVVERLSFLGGMGTAAYVGTICGLYFRSRRSARYVEERFAASFAERLRGKSKETPRSFAESLWFLPYRLEDFAITAKEILASSKSELLLSSIVVSAVAEESYITSVTAAQGEEYFQIRPKTVVDCSGEAVLARLVGGTVHVAGTPQASALVFAIDLPVQLAEPEARNYLYREFARGLQSGALSVEESRVSVVPAGLSGSRVYCKLALEPPGDLALPEYESRAREILTRLDHYLRSREPKLQVSFVASQVGIRTSPRTLGKYCLVETDVLEHRKYKGARAKGAWPIEFWGSEREPRMGYFAEEEYYDIPDGCLESAEYQNLFFAGRGLFASEQAAASARVMGTCFSTGERAGELAFQYAERS